jgi:hypothetical protein
MAWLISRALMADCENSHFSQVQAGESSGENSSGGGPSVPLSKTPMPQAYLSSDRMKEFSRPSRSGMTFAPLTESRGEAVLTWCQAGSRVRTSRQRDGEQASEESGPASGVRWRELFKRYDPVSSSWKTHRCLFDADLPESSVILPRWGMMRDGALSERLTLALRTSGNVSGLWPTPTTAEVIKIPATANYGQKGLNNHPKIRGLPNRPKKQKDRKKRPTPCASEGLDCGTNWASLAAVGRGGRIARRIATNGGPETQQTTHAQLNPAWVEWLMGWPIGWTDLKPLGTDKFRQWLHSHGGCSTGKPNKP